MRSSSLGLAFLISSSLACDAKESTPKPEEANSEVPAKTSPGSAAATGAKNGDGAGAKEAKKPSEAGQPSAAIAQVDPAAMEKDPNATKTVTAIDTAKKLPADAKASGEFLDALSWTDAYGKHAVVFGLTQREAAGSMTSLLVADFMSWEGDAWVSQRQFKERVASCQFDTTLKPFVGDWSITDLDENGIAEVTFAWRAGCRSDVSPLSHKVLLVGFDAGAKVAKYVLRGRSGIEIGGSLDPASSFRPDPAFKSAPPKYLEHAEQVWSKTAVETF